MALISLGTHPFAVPCPVFLLATYDSAGRPNLMTVAWGGLCASSPPSVAVSVRKATYSHSAIVARRAFTLNMPFADQAGQADFVGLVSGHSQAHGYLDKFAAVGFTPTPATHVDAPYVAECAAVLEVALTQSLEIGSHTHFIGEIMDAKIAEHALRPEGGPDIAALKPLCFIPLAREYWSLGSPIARAHSIGKTLPFFGVST